MAISFNLSFGKNTNNIERDRNGDVWYAITDFFTKKDSNALTINKKIELALTNPAVLKTLSFRADIYSQVKFSSKTTEDFLYSIKKQPNPNQSWVDLHWDISFWRDLGNAYIYKDGDVMYCLNPLFLDIKQEQLRDINQYRFSDYTAKKAKKGTFRAKFNSLSDYQVLKLENLYVISDLSNTISGNWMEGSSRLDALCQVAANSNLSLKSKNRNLFYTTKFSVSGQHDQKDVTSTPMSQPEQESVTKGLMGSKEIYATKHKIDVKQLVSNFNALKLDDSYLADLSIIANMYGMGKDILDIVSKGSTYENKEKAMSSFIDYSLMPKVNQHSDLYELLFDENEVTGSFKHLPFNAVFEAEKIANTTIELNNLKIALELGLNKSIVNSKLKQIYGN